jgi:SP family sugar:H+ symporter-like MFS transporter
MSGYSVPSQLWVLASTDMMVTSKFMGNDGNANIHSGVYFSGIQAMSTFVQHFGRRQADGTYAISASDLSIMSSMINVGELVGSLSAAPLNDFFGRKGAFLLGAITAIIGTVLQVIPDHAKGIIVGGRVILGLGVGIFSSTSPLYIAEVAPTAIRGPLLGCWQLTLSVSQLIAAVINRGTESLTTTASYRIPTAVQLIFPLLVLAFLYWVPESPRWLMRRSKEERCESALRVLHKDDKTYTADADMMTIRGSLAAEAEQSAESSWLDLIKDPIERRKTIYSAGALVAQQINGIQWFYYFGTVFSQAIGLEDPFLMSIIVFTIQIGTVLAAVFCANKVPRRPLLLTTTLIMMASIFIVGCLGIPGGDVSSTFGKVIISFVIIEITAFNFAWGPLGWTIVSIPQVQTSTQKLTFSRLPRWLSVATVTRSTLLPSQVSGSRCGLRSSLCHTSTTLQTWVRKPGLCTPVYASLPSHMYGYASVKSLAEVWRRLKASSEMACQQDNGASSQS